MFSNQSHLWNRGFSFINCQLASLPTFCHWMLDLPLYLLSGFLGTLCNTFSSLEIFDVKWNADKLSEAIFNVILERQGLLEIECHHSGENDVLVLLPSILFDWLGSGSDLISGVACVCVCVCGWVGVHWCICICFSFTISQFCMRARTHSWAAKRNQSSAQPETGLQLWQPCPWL